FVFGSLAISQEEKKEGKKKPIAMEEILITASPLNPKDIFDTPYSGAVITGDDISGQKLSRTIPDALREVPNVSIQKTSSGHGSPFIRGLTGFRNVLLIDGIRLNNSTFREGPNQYWNTVDEFLIDRLDVVKGPASVLYGSDAIGGTVVAYTKEPKSFESGAHVNTRTFLRYASGENSYTAREELSGNVDNVGYLIGGTWRDFNDITAGRASGELPGTGYDELDGDIKMIYRVDDTRKLIFAYQRDRQDDVPRTHRTSKSKEFAGTTIGTDRKDDYDQERDLFYIQYHWNKAGLFFDSAKFSLSLHKQAETFDRVKSNGNREFREFEVETPGIWLQFGSPTSAGFLTYGAEYYRDKVTSDGFNRTVAGVITDFARGEVADDSTYQTFGAYIQDEFSPAKDLDVTVGVRYNVAKLKADNVDPSGLGAPPLDSFSDTYSAFVGNIRFLYHFSENWNGIFGVSQGFRAPNLDDTTAVKLVMSGQTDYPSPDLKPEKSINFELGARAKYPKWDGEAFLFYTKLNDLIRRVPAPSIGPTVYQKDNFADGDIVGAELAGRYHITDDWTTFGDFGVTVGSADAYLNSSGTLKGKAPLDKVNPTTAHLGARYQPQQEKYWVEGLVTMVAAQHHLSPSDKTDTQRIPPEGTPGYVVYTIRGGVELCKNATATAVVENITDKDYRVHGSGQNETGTNFILGLDVRF
ncbi:MAG: hypothetical protein A2W23_01290, partial [Planctomycetes bacterium RBG_16_43_13]